MKNKNNGNATLRKRLSLIIGALSLALLGVSAYLLIHTAAQYSEGIKTYEELKSSAVAASDSFKAQAGAQEAPIEVDFDELLAINGDVVGWLYCEGTPINYPVVQGDDNSYYLKHLIDGSKNINGTLFIDHRNGANFADENTVVYGHHMKNGSMFASLVNYKSQEYFDAHPILYFLTPDGNYRIELFSGYVCDSHAAAFSRAIEPQQSYEEYLAYSLRKIGLSKRRCGHGAGPYRHAFHLHVRIRGRAVRAAGQAGAAAVGKRTGYLN